MDVTVTAGNLSSSDTALLPECWNATAALNHVTLTAHLTRRSNWKDSWGGLSFLRSHWCGVPRPKPGMHVLYPPEFLHTYLPIPISLFALQQSTAQLCRKQVHVDPRCGVSINGLGGENASRGQWTCSASPPSSLPSPWRTKGAWTYQRRTLRLHTHTTGPALHLL